MVAHCRSPNSVLGIRRPPFPMGSDTRMPDWLQRKMTRLKRGYGADRPEFLARDTPSPAVVSQPKLRRGVEPSTSAVGSSHQVARFKGAEVDVDFYAEIPADTVSTKRLPVQAGVFILPRALEAEVFALRADAFVGFEKRNVTLSIPFTRSEYVYSIEILSEDESIKTVTRGRLTIDNYREDQLTLSDLVLAHSVSSVGRRPTARQDLSYDPVVDLSFREDESVGVFFEVYPPAASLDALPSGRSLTYTVAVRIRDAVDGTIVDGGKRRGTSGDLGWTRTGIVGEDRLLDWFTLDIPWPKSGLYELEVEIGIPDYPVASGRRRFRVTPSTG